MTVSTNKTATTNKPAAAKTPASNVKGETPATDVKETATVSETSNVETPVVEEKKNRIPDALSSNPILADFCKRYLGIIDEIAEYNKAVLAERSSEWNAGKVLEKARDFSRPTDKNTKPKDEIKTALEKYESLVNETARARKAVLDITSKELGITLSAVADRDPAVEAPLKEKRKLANEIGTQLGMIAKMTTDESATAAVTEFLANSPLPAIGRDQARVFGADAGKATPKYRVTVVVTDKDGNEKVNEKGFTKAGLALTPLYERGKAIKSDKLREAWEAAGNNAENTVTNPVVFEDNGLTFTITKN